MCLSIPGRILEQSEGSARVDVDGSLVEADLSLVPDAAVGDYVLVHAGFAIQKYEEAEALETLALLKDALDGAS